MFFIRLLRRSFVRQLRRRSLIALTVALCASISVAMLGVVLDVGDKLNAELTNYGSNIVVQPRAGAVVDNLYETNKDKEAASFLDEKEVTNIKTIFWAYNIVDLTPRLSGSVKVTGSGVGKEDSEGTEVLAAGAWFNKDVKLSTGESTTLGVSTMRSWWKMDGTWPGRAPPPPRGGAHPAPPPRGGPRG